MRMRRVGVVSVRGSALRVTFCPMKGPLYVEGTSEAQGADHQSRAAASAVSSAAPVHAVVVRGRAAASPAETVGSGSSRRSPEEWLPSDSP